MDGTMDLYYLPASPPSRSVLLLAKALGITFNLKMTNIMAGEHMTPEYLKMNPQHTIPTLVDNDFIIWESRAILGYLVGQFDTNGKFTHTDPKKTAIVNQRLYFDACTLSPRLIDYFFPVVKLGVSPNDAKAAKFEEALELLDKFISRQVWIAGDKMTIADFAVVSTIATAEAVMFDITKYPNIWAWYQRCKKSMVGYEEINQAGADMLGGMFRSKIK